MKIFLSYNRKNEPFVRSVADQLSKVGYRDSVELFFDEDNLSAGDNWIKKIEQALADSDVCIVFIGEEGIGGWQHKEILSAVNKCVDSNGTYKIIPLILPHENTGLPKIFPWFLSDYQWVEFKDVNDPFAFNKLVEGIQQSESDRVISNGNNPYKGLDYFDVEDAPFYFGRTFDLNWIFYKKLRLNTTLPGNNFLAVVGDSGSGKSSFARAGILASLKAGKYEGSDKWLQIITKPEDRPLLNLSASLQKEKIISDAAGFDKNAIENKDHLRRCVEVYGNKMVLFIDQFEEVLTQCKAEAERNAYLQNLAEAVKSDKLFLLITLRSDYYASFTHYPEFVDLLENNNYTISELDYNAQDNDWEKRITDIIIMPVKLCGVAMEKNLVQTILNDIKNVSSVLPLLQMSLSELWKQKQHNNIIDLNDYAFIASGKGIGGIIEKHADKVYELYTINDVNQKKENLVKNIFIQLVELTAGKEDVRKTITKEHIIHELESRNPPDEIDDALAFFSGENARLISVHKDENNFVWIEVVHEALIRNWNKLKNWINARRNALLYKEDLIKDIEDYNANSKSKEYLYTGTRLKKAKEWLKENTDLATTDIKNFIGRTGEIQKRTRAETGLAFLIIALLAWMGYGLYKRYQFNHSLLATDLKKSNIDADSVHYLRINKQEYLQYLGGLKNLDSLVIEGPGIDLSSMSLQHNIHYLELSKLSSKNLTGVEKLDNLTSLMLSGLDSLSDLSGMEKLNKLSALVIDDIDSLTDLSAIERLKNLTDLGLYNLQNLQDVSALGKLNRLTRLELVNLIRLDNLSVIEKLQQLNYLTLYLVNVEDFSLLKKLTNLNELDIYGLGDVQNFSGIETLSKLTSLSIGTINRIKSLSGIGHLTELISLELYSLDSLRTLSGIEKLNKLTLLSIDNLKSLHNLSGIEHLPDLSTIRLYRADTATINSLFLSTPPGLIKLYIDKEFVSATLKNKLKQVLPNCSLFVNEER